MKRFAAVPFPDRHDALRGGALRGSLFPGTSSKPPWWSVSRQSRPGERLNAFRGGALRCGPLPETGSTPFVLERFAAVPFRGSARGPPRRYPSEDRLDALRVERFSVVLLRGSARRLPRWSASRRSPVFSPLSVVERFASIPFRGPVQRPLRWSASRRFPSEDLLEALRGGALRGSPFPVTASTPYVVKRLAKVPFRGPAQRPPRWSASRRFSSGDRLDTLRGGTVRDGPLPGTGSTLSVVKAFAAVHFGRPARRPPWWSTSRRFHFGDPLDALCGEAFCGNTLLWTGSTPSVVDCFASVHIQRPARCPTWWSAKLQSHSGLRLDASVVQCLAEVPFRGPAETPFVVERSAAVPFRGPVRLPT